MTGDERLKRLRADLEMWKEWDAEALKDLLRTTDEADRRPNDEAARSALVKAKDRYLNVSNARRNIEQILSNP